MIFFKWGYLIIFTKLHSQSNLPTLQTNEGGAATSQKTFSMRFFLCYFIGNAYIHNRLVSRRIQSASSPLSTVPAVGPALLQCLPLILVSETCHHIMFLPFQLEYMDFLPAQPALRKHCIMQGTHAQHNRELPPIYSASFKYIYCPCNI